MAFPQASDFRPPIIPDGEVYDNPENGKSYYWTQILLPEGSTPDTATAIGGYWTVVCDSADGKYVLIAGDTMTGTLEIANEGDNTNLAFDPDKANLTFTTTKTDGSDSKSVSIHQNGFNSSLSITGGVVADGSYYSEGGRYYAADPSGQYFTVRPPRLQLEKLEGTLQWNDSVRVQWDDLGGALQWDDSSRLEWNETNVEIPKPLENDANGDGFIIRGTTAAGYETTDGDDEDGKLLSVYHNADAADAINYTGKINSSNNLVNKGYVDDKDELLRQDIIELEEEIDAIAPSVERGQFISTAYSNAPRDGEFMLATLAGKTLDYGDPAIALIQLSKVDNEGVAHTYADVEDGQLLQLFEDGNADYGLYLIEAVAGNDDPTMTAVTFTVSPVSGSGEATEGDLARLKIFSAPSGGSADGFVLKTGDEMSGKLTFKNNLEVTELDAAAVPSRLTFKNKKSDGTENTLHLWQAGVQSSLVTNADFKVKRSISTGDYIYGWNGENSVLNPRIHMTDNYVDLKYGTTTKIGVGDTYTYYYGRHNFTDSTCRIYARAAYNSTSITYGTAGQALLSNGNNAPYWGTISFTQTKANWTETTTTSSAYIQNKPTVVTGSVSGIKITSSAGNYYIQG